MGNKANKGKGIGGWTIARRIVQAIMLVLFALPLLLTGWGIAGAYIGTGGEYALDTTPADLAVWGSLSSSQILGIDLLDPFATAQVIAAGKTVVGTMVWCLPILVGFAIVRGRAFCGWVCPVNLVLEAIDWLRKKLKLKAKVKASKGANKKVMWISSNEKYATVSESGIVRALPAGKGKKVKITAMATDGSGKKKAITIKIK